jgi:glycerol-3-phosphate O-acyltransferase / dihydroxyacetone phosphate acyltransferase
MLYALLRAVAAVALRWYYADVVVQGAERAPRERPLLVVANHPNALIDALFIGTALHRRVLLTAKATLFEQPAVGTLLRAVGVIPLRRASDERRAGRSMAPERNVHAFEQVSAALRRRGCVLVFPEGVSHDDPSIAPLRSGAARMAMHARDEGVADLAILPVGLVYEAKERPGSGVLLRVGEPLVLEDWLASTAEPDGAMLTATIDALLRSVTLNFASAERADRAVRLAKVFSTLATEPVGVEKPRVLDAELARRVDRGMTALADAPAFVRGTGSELAVEVEALQEEARRHGVSLAEARISTRTSDALAFVLREGPLVVIAGVCLVIGWATHWLPLRLARVLALRTLRRDPSRDQPAMRTILFGLAAVVLWYIMLAALLAPVVGPLRTALSLATIFFAAHLLRLRGGRLRRSFARARTYLAFRADPSLQPRIVGRIDALLDAVRRLEERLLADGDRAKGARLAEQRSD